MRWYAKDKAKLIENVRKNPRLKTALLRHHGISLEEYAEWVRAYDLAGKPGLMTTKLQRLRSINVLSMLTATKIPLARIERSTGVSATTLSNWVNGRHIPSRSTSELVVQFLQRVERVRQEKVR